MASGTTEQQYYLVQNAREIELNSHAWVQPIVIEDEDLQFGGKSLSTWYEEERKRLSSYSDEEERRGRQRVCLFLPLEEWSSKAKRRSNRNVAASEALFPSRWLQQEALDEHLRRFHCGYSLFSLQQASRYIMTPGSS
jgi:hypothetical protein